MSSGNEMEGLGPHARGPSFSYGPNPPGRDEEAGDPSAGRLAGTPPARGNISDFAPPRSAKPAVITIALIAVVAVVVSVATWMGNRPSAPVAQAVPSTEASAPAQLPSQGIDFASSEGSGRLSVLTHSWSDEGPFPPNFGAYLRVEVELSCTSGHVSYDPYFFQAFDAQGEVFDVADTVVARPALGAGTLSPGEAVRGFISFDMPRGAITLVMGNENSESVTAVRIRD